MTTETLSRTSSMLSHLSAIAKRFAALPTSEHELRVQDRIEDCIALMEKGHCDHCSLTRVAMTLGQVEAICIEHQGGSDTQLRRCIRLAEETMWEMIRTSHLP